jgi:tetratricopeptide (TPR) repeat protein
MRLFSLPSTKKLTLWLLVTLLGLLLVGCSQEPPGQTAAIKAEQEMDSGELDQAVIDYTEAIKLSPDNAIYIFNRGYVYFLQKKYDLALSDYNKALDLNPKFVMAYPANTE